LRKKPPANSLKHRNQRWSRLGRVASGAEYRAPNQWVASEEWKSQEKANPARWGKPSIEDKKSMHTATLTFENMGRKADRTLGIVLFAKHVRHEAMVVCPMFCTNEIVSVAQRMS
jgi:hypothetical protein